MPETVKDYRQILDREELREFVDSRGGVYDFVSELIEFQELCARLGRERTNLMDKFPDRWVVMDKDGKVIVGGTGGSLEDLLKEAETQGLKRGDLAIEFLDTDPPDLIL